MRYRHLVNVDPLPTGLHAINDHTYVEVEVEAITKNPPVCLNVSLNMADSKLSNWQSGPQVGLDGSMTFRKQCLKWIGTKSLQVDSLDN